MGDNAGGSDVILDELAVRRQKRQEWLSLPDAPSDTYSLAEVEALLRMCHVSEECISNVLGTSPLESA